MRRADAEKALEITRALYSPLIERVRSENKEINEALKTHLVRHDADVQAFLNANIRYNNKILKTYNEKIQRAELELKKSKP